MSTPEQASLPIPVVPAPAEVGFQVEEGAMVETVPGMTESRLPLEEVLRRHLKAIGAVASDPKTRQAAVTRLAEFESSPNPCSVDDPIYDYFAAGHEVVGYAKSVIANFIDTPTLRAVLRRGARETVQASICEDGGFAASTIFYEDKPLAEAIHASLQLAVAMYAQTHEGRPYAPAGQK